MKSKTTAYAQSGWGGLSLNAWTRAQKKTWCVWINMKSDLNYLSNNYYTATFLGTGFSLSPVANVSCTDCYKLELYNEWANIPVTGTARAPIVSKRLNTRTSEMVAYQTSIFCND